MDDFFEWDDTEEPANALYLDLYIDEYASYDDFVSLFWEEFRIAYGESE